MASVVFTGQYSDNSGREWTLEIYSLTTLANTNKKLDLLAPGVELTYEMDTASLAKAMIGSSASVTFQMTDAQLEKMNTLLSYDEGQVGLMLYRGSTTTSNSLEWAGHLLIESTSIYMHSEINTTSLTFTCGISHLKYIDYKDGNGDLWWDRQTLIRHIFRCVRYLPAQNFIRSRFYSGGVNFLEEKGLPAPANPGSTYHEWTWDSRGILDKVYVHSQTFGKPKDQSERHRNLFEEPEFINAYDVVEDICKTLGACIAFTKGRYVMWNRTSVFNFVDDPTKLLGWTYSQLLVSGEYYITDGRPYISVGSSSGNDVYSSYDPNRYTLDGATESRTLPLKQVLITHEDVEKDTIIAEGTARRRFRWMDPTPGQFSQHSLFDGFPGNSFLTSPANDQYSFGSNRNYGFPYVFDFTLYDFTDTGINPSYRNSLQGDNPLFRFGFPDRTNNDLAIVGGQDMTFSFAGSLKLREHIDDLDSSFISDTHAVNSSFILKARIEAVDTDDNEYRLSRTVNILDTPTVDVNVKLDALATSVTGTHKHKVYNDMNWLASDHEDYDDAWFEVIIPHGATANDQGDFENSIALLPGVFEGQSSYGGIFVEYNEDDERLQSRKRNIKDQFREHRFKENIKLAMPSDADDVFKSIKLSWRLTHIGGNGSVIFESGTDPNTSNATFPTSSGAPYYSDHFNYPERVTLQYAEIRLGNGARDMDLITKATGGPGFETYNIGSSRIGSRDGLLNPQVTGHLIAPYNTSNNTLDTNGADPALNGFGFVNVKWTPFRDGDGPDVGRYDSLHELVTSEYLACFGKQMKRYTGTIIEKNQSATESILRPYMVFNTKEYSETLALDIMLTRLNWSMLEGYKFEGLEINATRYAQVNIAQEEQKPKGPGSGRNPDRPGLAEKLYGSASGRIVRDIANNSTEIGDLDTDLDAVRDDVTVNNAKVSFPGFGTTSDKALPGDTQTIDDIDNLPVLARTDGTEDPVTVVAEDPDLLVLAVQSKVSGQQGVKKFTVQELFQGVIQGGLQDMEDGGYIEDVADYEGSTYGVLGDFDDDGSVTTADLLDFLILYGSVYVGDNGAFFPAEIHIDPNNGTVEQLNFSSNPNPDIQYFPFSDSDLTVTPSGVSINTYGSDESPANTIEFVSGTNPQYPITSWTQKKIQIYHGGSSLTSHIFLSDGYVGQAHNFVVNIKTYNSSGTLLDDHEEIFPEFVNSVAAGRSYSYQTFFGTTNAITIPYDLSSPDITKIQVRVGMKPATANDRIFYAALYQIKVRLASVSE